ncbi:hypothetical protein CVT24_000383 [Panaeolus cyanescens]|uniref:Initiator tRNA phosphoribosyl transferase n=1 Tax=Panaeolus cyanescens TaxID=181874 RepID=A0A409YD56_9AGAR|nr:hypothetical protein CVT24_000383 [Panaeolus cyanescens]
MKDSNALEYIRKESLDIYNRIHSIQEDVEFIRQVREEYSQLPLLPNLRCGAWYTDPKIATDIPAYFKSTDGHNNNWSFNLRRSNLHLIPFAIQHHGFILVDSTRSGKRIPDALSKTVPIWCSVINRAMKIRYPEMEVDNNPWDVGLFTPPNAVSLQEHHQIELRLDRWAKDLADSSFELPRLPCPLRPLWITPATSVFPSVPKITDSRSFLPVICVSASKQIDQGVERRHSGFSYIQGSGDDHELWGMGLTPKSFWRHRREILEASRDTLPSLVSDLVRDERTKPHTPATNFTPSPIQKVSGRIRISTFENLLSPTLAADSISHMQIAYLVLTSQGDIKLGNSSNRLCLQTLEGKKGQSQLLHSILPQAMNFIEGNLKKGVDVCVACDTGKDLSVGVALVALQQFFDDQGNFRVQGANMGEQCYLFCCVHWKTRKPSTEITKRSIRTRLEWIIASRPQANPSRNTLKKVNEYLLTPASFYTSNVDILTSTCQTNVSCIPEVLE